VIHFSQQTNLPLRVGILLDTSNSIRQRFQFEQDAATEFFLQVLHRTDAAFVTGFDVRTDIEQDYTNNIDLLNQASIVCAGWGALPSSTPSIRPAVTRC